MANTQIGAQTPMDTQRRGGSRRSVWMLLLIPALAAAGWWALQSGLIDQHLGQNVAAETAAAMPAQTAEMPAAGLAPATEAAMAVQPDVSTGAGGQTGDSGSGVEQVATNEATAAAQQGANRARVSVPVLGGVKGAPVWDDAGGLVAGLGSGAAARAFGRSADGVWLAVETGRGAGWVLAEQVIAYGTSELPVSDPPAAVVAKAEEQADTSGGEEANETAEQDEATKTVAPGAAGEAVTPTSTGAELPATVVTAGARLNVRAGPGTGYAVIAKEDLGAAVAVAGRNEAGDWLLMRLGSAEGAFGWAAAAYLQVEGDIAALPVSSAVSDAEPLPGSAAASDSSGVADAAAPATVISAAALPTGLSGTLVFQDDRGGTIWVYELATGALRALTHGSDPAISPDGSTVAFVRDGGNSGLYLIGIDGSNERRIFERVRLGSPKWSPDGQWILFSRGDEIQECYELGQNQCLTYSDLLARFPTGVPDTINAPLVKKELYHLSAVDVNGSNFHDIPATLAARAPDWSAGGIVYQSAGSLQRTADATGDANRALAADSLNPAYYDPDWQPDGGQIVFQRKGAAQTDIYGVNADGSGMAALTRPATTLVEQLPSNVAPAYSPDGQHIVFLSNRTDSGEAGAWRLWVMDADGGNQQPLPVDVLVSYNFGAEQVVSWGP